MVRVAPCLAGASPRSFPGCLGGRGTTRFCSLERIQKVGDRSEITKEESHVRSCSSIKDPNAGGSGGGSKVCTNVFPEGMISWGSRSAVPQSAMRIHVSGYNRPQGVHNLRPVS